jgi:hypothetical protein
MEIFIFIAGIVISIDESRSSNEPLKINREKNIKSKKCKHKCRLSFIIYETLFEMCNRSIEDAC